MSTKIISAEKIESAKSAIKNAVDKANNAGYQEGYALGNSKGIETGKQEEYNRFWNEALGNGNREYYAYAFGSIFNDNNFNPPSTIIPKSQEACKVCEHNNNGTCDIYGALPTEKKEAVAQGMFQGSRIKRTLNDSDVDWQCVPQMNYAFSSSSFIDVANINAKNCTSMKEAFWWCNSLKKVEFTGYGRVTNWTKAFYRCSALEHVRFWPVYDDNNVRTEYIIRSIDFGDCKKLTYASIVQILGSLSPNVSGYTVRFSLDAVNKAFESTNGANDGADTFEWQMLAFSIPSKWIVVLI